MGSVYTITEATRPWLLAALKKLQAIARLQRGWDSYDGLPLRQDIGAFALSLLRGIESEDLPVPSVVLGSAGTVQFEWAVAGRELEIEAISPTSFVYLKVFANGETEEGEVASDHQERLRQLGHWLQTGE